MNASAVLLSALMADCKMGIYSTTEYKVNDYLLINSLVHNGVCPAFPE
jgi:hypothetical protein